MELQEIIPDAECGWCHKAKQVVRVVFQNGKTTLLCWKDLQRMAAIELQTKSADGSRTDETNS